jgi:hypothetical protein
MTGLSKTIEIVLTVSLILSKPVISNGIPSRIEISSKYTSIQIGEPLIFELVYIYEEPLITQANGKIKENFIHHAYLKIEHHEGKFLTDSFPIYPMELKLQDKPGLKYSGQFVFLYHPSENRLLFPVPGTYTVTVRGYTKTSNPLNISVKPLLKLQKRALSFLSDPNDYRFLEYGSHEDPEKRIERVSHLKQVVEQCQGTLLSKWAAARLGLEYFKDFHKKHSSFQKFKTELQESKVKEPLFDQAYKYLSAGYALPGEFPVREQVLYELSVTEYIKDNYEKAFSLLDELSATYPTGKYGKRASSGKAELQELQERDLGQSTKPTLGQASSRAALPVVVAAIAVGIALIGLILIFKKKPRRSRRA